MGTATEDTEEATDPTVGPGTTMNAEEGTGTIITAREGAMRNTKVVTWSLALFGAVTYLVCIVYGLIVPESLHMSGFLEQVLPGFRWLTPAGFVIGLVEAFLYGAYAGLVFTPIHNRLWKRWGAA